MKVETDTYVVRLHCFLQIFAPAGVLETLITTGFTVGFRTFDHTKWHCFANT